MKEVELKVYGKLQGVDAKATPKKAVHDIIYGAGSTWPHHIYDMLWYNLNFRRLEITKAQVAEARFKEKGLTMKDNCIAIYQVPRKGEVGQMSPNMTMYVRATDPDYPRYIYHIETALMTGKPASGNSTDPWFGKKFKPLMKVNISDIRKAKIVVAKKSSSKKKAINKAMQELGFEALPSFKHNYNCKDCKALEALANMSKSLDTLITKGGKIR